MADNAEQIAEIDELLATGLTSSTLPDGQSQSFDHDSLRKKRAALAAEDDTLKAKRPRILGMNISGVT